MEMPYYAVIFSSIQTGNLEGYAEMAKKMLALAAEQDGYLGVASAHDSQLGITISIGAI
jgi:heme-degrading monooxygenase HmoA